ncbi:MAG: hypothetical protein FJX11_23055, partial [Alphaproteobacteria bacterium]|nr:hypothetical protein [Alphaproteobacteria bacterium]
MLHFDSLVCLPALDALFEALGGRIGLVVSSDRFASMAGFLRQLRRNLRHSGLRLTVALGFDIVALRIAGFFAPAMRALAWPWRRLAGGDHVYWRRLPELAAGVQAPCVTIHDINARAALDLIRRFAPDLVISFHFDQILQPAFLEAAACPVVNVHPALLPAHRGPCPSFWALAAGDSRVGVTVHRIVDATIDAGPVLVRRQRALPAGVCMGELDERLFADGAAALAALLSSRPTAEVDPAGSPAAYESFPDGRTVRAARRRGVGLWRLAQAVRLIAGLFGWYRPAPPA